MEMAGLIWTLELLMRRCAKKTARKVALRK